MSKIDFSTIKDALAQPQSEHFRIRYSDGEYQTGNKMSFYNKDLATDPYLTFDIANNKALANVNARGTVKHLTFYRSSYRANPAGWMWPGVWVYKDYSKWGPYSFKLKLDGEILDMDEVDWPFTTSLLDNLFPITNLRGKNLAVTLLTFAPISADGKKRPRGIIHGAWIENTSKAIVSGSVQLPALFSKRSDIQPQDVIDMDTFHPDDADIALADTPDKSSEVAFILAPGQGIWVPAVIYSPGEPTVEEIDEKGSLAWLNATWNYYKGITGKLTMPDDKFTEEFFQRAVLQCFGSIGMDGNNKIAGSNWGTYPTTRQIWMKDMYYSFLPLAMFEPELFKEGILWFLEYGIRPSGSQYQGGINHALVNSLSSIMMAGLYYESTGDKSFFSDHNEIKETVIMILEKLIASRQQENVWLFPTLLISDGDAVGDYHTGSNLCAWFAFSSFSKILEHVYHDFEKAEDYKRIADKIQAAMEQHNVIDGAYGKQYIEGINADGSVPYLFHEGEETDTTLMPVYGYLPYDNETYKNYTKFALSSDNIAYSPNTKGIHWGMHVGSPFTDASFPGYITGLANVVDRETMNGENGYMSEIKKLTDVDGSIWWWPYPEGNSYGNIARNNICGKCAWASGVFVSLFVSEFLGIKYDAISNVLRLRPFSPSSDFTWENFTYGKGKFSAAYKKTEHEAAVELTNKNNHSIKLELELMIDHNDIKEITSGNEKLQSELYEFGEFLGQKTIKLSAILLPGELKQFSVRFA